MQRDSIQEVNFAPSLPKSGFCSSKKLQDVVLVHQNLLYMEDAEDSRDHGPFSFGFALMRWVRMCLPSPSCHRN